MKIRIITTTIVSTLYLLAMKLINFYYSPLSGSSTALQLNDNIEGYSAAKFIRDGNLDNMVTGAFILSLIFIWINFFFPSNKQNKQ